MGEKLHDTGDIDVKKETLIHRVSDDQSNWEGANENSCFDVEDLVVPAIFPMELQGTILEFDKEIKTFDKSDVENLKEKGESFFREDLEIKNRGHEIVDDGEWETVTVTINSTTEDVVELLGEAVDRIATWSINSKTMYNQNSSQAASASSEELQEVFVQEGAHKIESVIIRNYKIELLDDFENYGEDVIPQLKYKVIFEVFKKSES